MLTAEQVPREEIEALWDRYKREACRERKASFWLMPPWCATWRTGLAINLPRNVALDDLVGQGVIGLFDTLEKFQPDRGVKFETYALARIRGAIIDGLRANDWVPRSVRRRARELEQAIAELEGKLGRSATDGKSSKR